jgi:hypothetical protein
VLPRSGSGNGPLPPLFITVVIYVNILLFYLPNIRECHLPWPTPLRYSIFICLLRPPPLRQVPLPRQFAVPLTPCCAENACYKHMFPVFQRYIANVPYGCCKGRFGCCTCCNGYTRNSLFKMFHLFETFVASVLSRCSICCNSYIASVCS